MSRKNSKNAAAKNAAPATPPADAAPADMRRGYAASADFATVPALLSFYETRPVNDLTKRGARFDFFANATIPNVNVSDVPNLLTLAASILAACGFTFPNVSAAPMSAIHALAGTYYTRRHRHSLDQRPSTADEFDTAGAVAEMLIANVDRLRNNNTRRAFGGSYGKTDRNINRASHVAAALAAMMTAAPAPSVVDSLASL